MVHHLWNHLDSLHHTLGYLDLFCSGKNHVTICGHLAVGLLKQSFKIKILIYNYVLLLHCFNHV